MCTFITVTLNGLPSLDLKLAFARRMRYKGLLAVCLYVFALLLFMAGFSLYGFSKMKPPKGQPVLGAAVGDTVIIVCAFILYRWHAAASRLKVGGSDSERGSLLDGAETAAPLARAPSRHYAEELNMCASRALFFACFGYFAGAWACVLTAELSRLLLVVILWLFRSFLGG